MNKFGFPDLGFGLGLRAQHYDYVLENRPKIGWFEIISENFIDAHKGYWEFLDDLRQAYPIVMHGVSLSIGSTDPLDVEYLQKIKKLAEFLKAPWVSDHLCFTGVNGLNSHDLLPVPYTDKALQHIISRVKQVQNALERTIILENPSSYFEFASSEIPEWEFMTSIAEEADCGILLDVNNVYVSAFNHGYDPRKYIDSIPGNRIVQIHLAGHLNKGTHIIDTHDNHVVDDVWDLYSYTLRTKGFAPTMIEWDANIPDFPVVMEEIRKAEKYASAKNMAA